MRYDIEKCQNVTFPPEVPQPGNQKNRGRRWMNERAAEHLTLAGIPADQKKGVKKKKTDRLQGNSGDLAVLVGPSCSLKQDG